MFDINPNWFAYFALLIWPVVALYLYSRLPLGLATLWTILGGYLLLPVGTVIKYEMVPAFEKTSIPNLAALICCALFHRSVAEIFSRIWACGDPNPCHPHWSLHYVNAQHRSNPD